MEVNLNASRNRAAILIALLFAVTASTRAATPQLSSIEPRGTQRGTEADWIIRGARLEDAKELMIYSPGVTITSFEAKPTEIRAHVKVDKDARIGEYCCRVRSETGISELRTFYVGPFPIVPFQEGKPDKRGKVYYDFDHPQLIDLNVTVSGGVATEQVQYFAVDMKKGQHLTAEVHGMRLGDLFDPYVAILDEKRFELAVSDDTALAMQDPIASTLIPADGRYVILLRESSYGAGSHYLLHVGTFPRPRIVYPLGGRPGEELHAKYLGDVSGPIETAIKLPAKEVDSYDIFPTQDGLTAPSPNHIRVSDMPNVLEQEPNDDVKTATVYSGDLPVAFNGIIEKPADIDFFRFKAKKGDQLDVRVLAQTLRSPLDSVLTIYNANGNAMASNDDSGGPDSYIRFNVPDNGEYAISVTDQLHQGGPDYAYRVEITSVKPGLVLTIPQYAQNSQERWTVPVPRGNRYATLMRATRVNTGGDVTLGAKGLPQGMSIESADGSVQEFPVVFEARADAPIAGGFFDLTADLLNGDKKVDVAPRYEQKIDLVYTGNAPLYVTSVDKVAVAVTKEAPFKLHLEQPKVPLVQGGSMDMKITAERAAGFTGAIQVKLLYTPNGIGAISNVEMAGDKSEITYPLNAQSNAQLTTWKVCMVGMSDVNGQVWVSSELVNLQVAEPYLLAETRMTAIEQGKNGVVTFKLDQKIPFDGKAKAKLLGLPANVTADEVEISAADKTVNFPVTVGEKSPAGNHPSLFCSVTIMKNGEPMVHNLGQGGNLRVDKPPVAKVAEPVKVAAKPEKKPVETPKATLSRLEKLREESGQK